MKYLKTLKKHAGEIFTTVIVVTALVGLVGTLTIKAVNNLKGSPSYTQMKRLQNGEADSMTPAEIAAAENGAKIVAKQAQILGAGGQMINSINVEPDAGTAISVVAGVCIDKTIEHGMSENPRPTSSKALPTDVTTSIPGCTSGNFTCGNGTVICASKVCNSSNDCGDNTDEGSSMCRQALSCCQATNGCPGETASSCASSCCCCPYGQICDRANPGRGCIAG